MTQEQQNAIKLASQAKYTSKGYETAVKKLHFSWGCTHVINNAAQFGLVDSIKADTVLHVGLAQLEAENTRYRQALESIATRWNKVAEHNDMRTTLHLIQQDVFEALKNNGG